MARAFWRTLNLALVVGLSLASSAAAQKAALPLPHKGAPAFNIAAPQSIALTPFQPAAAAVLTPQTRPTALAAPSIGAPKRRVLWSPPAKGYFSDHAIPQNERLENFIRMTTRFWDVKDIVSPASGEAYAAYLNDLASPKSPVRGGLAPRTVRRAAREELGRVNRLLPAERETAAVLDAFKNEFGPNTDEQKILAQSRDHYARLAAASDSEPGPTATAFASYLRRKIRHIEKQFFLKESFYNRSLNFGEADLPDQTAYREAIKTGLDSRTPVDYAGFFRDSRVLLIGETHRVKSHRHEILGHLKELRRAGVTHILVEGISASRQEWLDRFTKDERSFPYSVGTLSIQSLALARKLGMRVLAMDMPSNTVGGLNAAAQGNGDRLAAERDAFLLRRNRFMAQMIARTLRREPNAKIAAIVGAAHAHALGSPLISLDQQSTSIPAELSSRHGIRSKTIRLVDGTNDSDQTAAGLISEHHLATQRFFIPLGPDGGLLHVPFRPRLSTLPIPE